MQAEYEFYLLDAETRQPPFGGTDITTTLTNQRLPVLPRARARTCRRSACARGRSTRSGARRSTSSPSRRSKGLAGGDDNFTYKTYAKEIAAQHGLLASFMTKPFIDASGSSSHLHMSLFDGAPQHLLGRRRRAS